jgi:hypothetical protein
MPAPIQNLPADQMFFLLLVIVGFSLFFVSLLATWVYMNLVGETKTAPAKISAAVRPGDSAVNDTRQAA